MAAWHSKQDKAVPRSIKELILAHQHYEESHTNSQWRISEKASSILHAAVHWEFKAQTFMWTKHLYKHYLGKILQFNLVPSLSVGFGYVPNLRGIS